MLWQILAVTDDSAYKKSTAASGVCVVSCICSASPKLLYFMYYCQPNKTFN